MPSLAERVMLRGVMTHKYSKGVVVVDDDRAAININATGRLES